MRSLGLPSALAVPGRMSSVKHLAFLGSKRSREFLRSDLRLMVATRPACLRANIMMQTLAQRLFKVNCDMMEQMMSSAVTDACKMRHSDGSVPTINHQTVF